MGRHVGRFLAVAVLLAALVGLAASGAAVATNRARHKKPRFSQNLADYVPATVDGMPVIEAGQTCPAGTQSAIGPNDPLPPVPPGEQLIAATLCYPGTPPGDYARFFFTQITPAPTAGVLKTNLDQQGPIINSLTPVKVLGAPGYWYLYKAGDTDPGRNTAAAEPRPGLTVSVDGKDVVPGDGGAGKPQVLATLRRLLAAGKGQVKRLPPTATPTPTT